MERSNDRGQSSLELVVIALVLSTFLFAVYALAEQSRSFFKPVWLSRDLSQQVGR